MSLQKRDNIKKELSTLSCPFTWQLTDASNHYVKTQKLYKDTPDDNIDEEAYLTLEKLISCLVILYEKVLFNEMDRANIKLEECEKLLMEMKDKREEEDIMRVIEHIFNSTKCHYLFELNKIEQLKIILPTIIRTSDFDNIELAALIGCQSVAWSIFLDYGRIKAMDLANQAIEKNSDKALWHFILAKNARKDRRLINRSSAPSEIEKLHFKVAYNKSPNPVFGIYLAQMYRECSWTVSFPEKKNYDQLLLSIYKELLRSNEHNYKILLKLALGFVRINSSCESELAKYCLDAIEKMEPYNSTYFHYKGIYLQKFGDMKEALEFFKKAGELHNYPAEMDYVKYGWKAKLLDPLIHLQSMLVKYDRFNERKQEICLNIAICYYQRQDMKRAIEYYLKAIEIDPNSKKLKIKYTFLNFTTQHYKGGMYDFLKSTFLKTAKNCVEYRRKNQIFIKAYNKLQHLCSLYDKRFDTHQVSNVEE
ncbi:hypothetical protein KPH14_002581 [Odynerus spinipes]|uniref:Tetratricopeptide repeat protein n=1 Tax=Odynerus spinipes TaxID=1348599 RepID=A0AAD9RF56_9HYME|nr:hypothetical protein KPH14_002581 [Odynerus spinipes]